MSLAAKAFIFLIIASGAAVFVYGFSQPLWPDILRFVCYLLLVMLASCFKIILPGINGTMSVNFLFMLIGIIELSLPENLALACAATLVQTLWKNQGRIKPIHVAFNAAQMANTVALCFASYHYAGPRLGAQTPITLLITASVYFLANTIPVAAVVSLTEHKTFQRLWAQCYFWSFPYYLVGAGISGLINWTNRNIGWQASLFVIPVVYLMYRSYRLYLAKLEDEKKHVEQMAALHLRTIEALALAIEAKDHTTYDHLRRVRIYAIEIGKELGLREEELDALRAAALLHDIGKLAIPEHIINKPGPLSPEEFDKIKIHPIVGAEMLERVEFPYPVAPMVRSHHEKWDGTGYPDGLKGEQIPIGARILATVDCLDALASDRPYRRALPLEEALNHVCSQAGQHFDPQVIAVLKRKFVELEAMAKEDMTVPTGSKLSSNIRVLKGAAPGSGLAEERATASRGGSGFLGSIIDARCEVQALLELSIDLGKSLSVYETLSVVAARLRKLIPYDAISMYFLHDDKLVPEYVTGDDFRLFSSLRIPLGGGLSGWVAQNRRPILNGDPSVELACLNDSPKTSSLCSALVIPLTGIDDFVGVLALYKAEKDGFSADHLRILQAVSEKIGASMENAVKYQTASDSATTDYITGLPNARSLFLHLDGEIARCRRERNSLAAIVCDLDGFKLINDRYGHLRGNKVLETFAAKLKLACREYDYVGRMGGDEFVIIAPGLRKEAVEHMCARLSESAAESSKEVCGDGTLCVSIGIAFYPDEATDAEQLLVAADKRMYSMKQVHHSRGLLIGMPAQSNLTQ